MPALGLVRADPRLLAEEEDRDRADFGRERRRGRGKQQDDHV
jgi:hypothetical protein